MDSLNEDFDRMDISESKQENYDTPPRLSCERLDCDVYRKLANKIVELDEIFHQIVVKNRHHAEFSSVEENIKIKNKIFEIKELVWPSISDDGEEILQIIIDSITENEIRDMKLIHNLIVDLRDRINQCYKNNKCAGNLDLPILKSEEDFYQPKEYRNYFTY